MANLSGYLAERERIELGAVRGPWMPKHNKQWDAVWLVEKNRRISLIAANIWPGANANFIADCRTAVPTLIAMVREATEALREVERSAGESDEGVIAETALARLDVMATEDAT